MMGHEQQPLIIYKRLDNMGAITHFCLSCRQWVAVALWDEHMAQEHAGATSLEQAAYDWQQFGVKQPRGRH